MFRSFSIVLTFCLLLFAVPAAQAAPETAPTARLSQNLEPVRIVYDASASTSETGIAQYIWTVQPHARADQKNGLGPSTFTTSESQLATSQIYGSVSVTVVSSTGCSFAATATCAGGSSATASVSGASLAHPNISNASARQLRGSGSGKTAVRRFEISFTSDRFSYFAMYQIQRAKRPGECVAGKHRQKGSAAFHTIGTSSSGPYLFSGNVKRIFVNRVGKNKFIPGRYRVTVWADDGYFGHGATSTTEPFCIR